MSTRRELLAYVRERLTALGMGNDAIALLLAKAPAQRTREIRALFAERQDDMEKADLLNIIFVVGDVRQSGDFFIEILEGDNDWLKCCVATNAWVSDKYKKHAQFTQVLDAYLKGADPLTVWLRSELPNSDLTGESCLLRNGEDK